MDRPGRRAVEKFSRTLMRCAQFALRNTQSDRQTRDSVVSQPPFQTQIPPGDCSGRRLSGTTAGALAHCTQLLLWNIQNGRELCRDIAPRRDLTTIDTPDNLRRDAGRGARLGLRQPAKDAPASQVALVARNVHYVGNSDSNDFDNRSEVNARRLLAKLPVPRSLAVDPRTPRNFNLAEAFRLQPARNPSTHRLRRSSRRTAAHAFIRCAQLFHGDAQSGRQLGSRLVSQPRFPTLDGTNHGRTDTSRSTELRLREANQHSPIARKAVHHRNIDQIRDFESERGGDPGQHVNLGRAHTSFPPTEGRLAEVTKACEVATGHTSTLSGRCQSLRIEAAHHSTRHRKSSPCDRLTFIAGHNAPPYIGSARQPDTSARYVGKVYKPGRAAQ